MRTVRWIALAGFCILLLGCGRSKLASLLPDPPEGWSAEGKDSDLSVSGVGRSSARSYIPTGATSGLGVQRVTVQILIAEKGADHKKLLDMSIASGPMFKSKTTVAGFPAFESFPLPSNERHSLDILPKADTYIQIVAYKGGPAWESGENRQKAVSAFAGKMDFKKIAAIE
jgi:hypothetical protein